MAFTAEFEEESGLLKLSEGERGRDRHADYGPEPTLISPLAALTHSAPEVGYMAFNRTSSATPAIAGLAAILISAIKQEGLPLYAHLVVNALRLSSQEIPNAAFIEQWCTKIMGGPRRITL